MKKEGFIEVTGGRVWYQKFGVNSPGTPLIILHGGPGSSSFSLQGLKELSKDRPVFFYDQLGCGKSERPFNPSLWTIDRFVEELAQVREALSLDELHILGHSWGTTLAATYCLTKPLGIKSIIFSSPCLSAPIWATDQDRNRRKLPEKVQEILKRCEENGTTNSKEYEEATSEFNKRFVCRLNPFPEFLKEGSHLRNPEIYKIMWGPSEFHVTGNLKNFDCTSRLNEINVPTLFTCGHFDEATPETTKYFSSLVLNSQFHVYEKSAHMAYVEQTEEYLTIVGNFLNSVDKK